MIYFPILVIKFYKHVNLAQKSFFSVILRYLSSDLNYRIFLFLVLISVSSTSRFANRFIPCGKFLLIWELFLSLPLHLCVCVYVVDKKVVEFVPNEI